jgi:hypothetical protein
MPAPLARFVGMPAYDNHPHNADCIGDCGYQPNAEISLDAECLDDGRQPEGDFIKADHQGEVDETERPDLCAFERIDKLMLGFMLVFRNNILCEQLLFFGVHEKLPPPSDYWRSICASATVIE